MPEDGSGNGTDPTAVAVIAVTADDVVTALETNWRSDRHTVLRITPPFAGRMRARLHRPLPGDDARDAVHVDPSALVADPPPYPTPDETADRLREADAYTTERHHERHAEAVEAWRRAVRDSLVGAVDLPTAAGPHRVEVTYLG
ncbi:hypothetical protein [Haloplanus halophilus]|uniref:hypothetical protein n=1 Tax=Haloplanus halophilus TaxID=2949993 RepID=UPI00203C599E|nr:hypothetical protein [Haloplanus sp. GDY1]